MKILLIEDESKTAQSIKTWLQESMVEVDCAFDGLSGKLLAERNTYDVIVSDVVMPKINGIELCRHFRSIGLKVPILLLSALSQPEDRVSGLNAGADDFLTKPFDFNELFARIQALIRRSNNQMTQSNKLYFADLELNMDTLEVRRKGVKIALTPREFELIVFLVQNQGRVLRKAEILEEVWNLDVEINTNIVEVYVNYLRNKIDKGFEPKLIHTHFGVGYILKVEPGV